MSKLFDFLPEDTIKSFQYFIIMPNNKNNEEFDYMKSTVFNRFDENIVESSSIRIFISRLPATLKEYISDWPMSSNNYETNARYDIKYIYENNVDNRLIENINSISYGCVFLMKEINKQIRNKIISGVKLPIISCGEHKDTLPLDERTIKKLYRIWEDNLRLSIDKACKLNNFVRDDFSIPELYDKTKIPGINAPSTKFLDPLNILVDRLRGLYYSTQKNIYNLEFANPKNAAIKEQEADDLIIQALKRVISEKFLIFILGVSAIEKNNLDKSKDLLQIPNLNLEKLKIFLNDRKWEDYNSFSNIIFDDFDKLQFKTDMTLCIPSINYFVINEFNDLLGKYKFPKKILRKLYDSNTYYHISNEKDFSATSEEKRGKNLNTFVSLIGELAKENLTLSTLFVNYSLAKEIPFIRSRNVPSSQVYDLAKIMDDYSLNLNDKRKVADFNKNMRKISNEIQRAYSVELWKIIKKHSLHIKVLTDMPVEWLCLEQLPLCVEKSISRLPIMPGNGLIAHSYFDREYNITPQNFEIMIINTLEPDDNIFNMGVFLNKTVDLFLKKISKKAIYIEAKNKEEFINAIEQYKPPILIYYGHGSYDNHNMIGKLLIRNESINSIEMEKIKWKPIITILGACETQVIHGSHLNVANLFLGSGAASVLGTFFPIDADHALSFINGLVRNLVNCIANRGPNEFEYWSDIILMTYRSHYLLDPILTLEENLRKKKICHNTVKDCINEFFQICSDKKFSLVECYEHRDEIFLEVFKSDEVMYKNYKDIVDTNSIIQRSLFFSSLGSPEKIKIIKMDKKLNIDNRDSDVEVFGMELDKLIK